MADPSIAEGIALPPKEAIAFFRQKTNQTTERWTDVWNEAHARAFSVAGAASEALVQDFRDAVKKAIEQGTTLADFRKDFDSIVAKHGWVHNGTAAWRSQIIYETNLSTAYSAGRYAQMTEPDVLEAFPYWRYQHNAAIHPRIQHLDWSGLVLAADDPWWSTHYPPNGWRCHCSVSAVSEGGLRRMGRTKPDKAPPLDLQKVSIRTSDGFKTVEVPRGIDPSFAYNPGQAWLQHAERPVVGQLPARPPSRLRAEAVQPPVPDHGPVRVQTGQPEMDHPIPPPPSSPAAEPAARTRRAIVHVDPGADLGPVPVQAGVPERVHAIPPPPAAPQLPRPPATLEQVKAFLERPAGTLNVGVLHPDVAKAIGAERREVLLSADTLEKQTLRHPDLKPSDYAALAEVIAAPTLVLQDGPQHVVMFRRVGRLFLAVVKRTGDGSENYVVSAFKCDAKDVRRYLRRGAVLLGSADAALGDEGQ